MSGAAGMDTDAVLAMLQEVAAEVVTPRFRALDEDEVSEKNPGDLVTVADREAEELITARLRAAYPDAMVLGEEAVAADASLLTRFAEAEHAFTVDPVDGTKNFVKGSPDHAVMAAELQGGAVVRSWIWQPQHEHAYVAEHGAGAWRDGERLTRPDRTDTRAEDLRGVTSRRSWLGRAIGTLRALELTWVCCGVDYPKLVEGAADYALFAKAKPWDHAPGQLLLAEAGGVVGTFTGDAYAPQRTDDGAGLVAAGDRETYDLVRGLVHALPGL
ncbi:inositol monophosphatase [Nocardioidaceae bacterium]|nr:inositol monophosphatase [Nocardioidaceae bacterium]